MPRTFGRFPFAALTNKYLEALSNHRAATTLVQLRRDLRTISLDVKDLFDSGRLTTSNPKAMTVNDIAAIIGFWRIRPKRGPNARFAGGTLDRTSQTHLWRALKGLLEYVGNGAVGQLKTLPHVETPRTLDKPIDTLSEEDLQRLRAAADSIRGWRGAAARFLVDFCPGTALRPKEVRLQELACIDARKHAGIVCHPKGEGTYAAAHTAPFVIDAVAGRALAEFLPERAKFLDGEASLLLIPYRNFTGEVDGWPESSLRKLMSDLSKTSGVHVSLQEFRATFGQRAIDNGASIEAVSRCMRHKTTVTTERFYARMRPDNAMDEVRGALNRNRPVKVAPKKSVSIDSES
ncbi:MAG: site-specific integrase [Thermoplasmata archaeon]|nr:site-specific integrase [Thermoplasmata archaeon]